MAENHIGDYWIGPNTSIIVQLPWDLVDHNAQNVSANPKTLGQFLITSQQIKYRGQDNSVLYYCKVENPNPQWINFDLSRGGYD